MIEIAGVEDVQKNYFEKMTKLGDFT